MLFVICYDISDDATRRRLGNQLLDFGVRVQESVFEAVLDGKDFGRMIKSIGQIPIAATDRIRAYRVCADCAKQVKIYGQGEVTRDPDYWIV